MGSCHYLFRGVNFPWYILGCERFVFVFYVLRCCVCFSLSCFLLTGYGSMTGFQVCFVFHFVVWCRFQCPFPFALNLHHSRYHRNRLCGNSVLVVLNCPLVGHYRYRSLFCQTYYGVSSVCVGEVWKPGRLLSQYSMLPHCTFFWGKAEILLCQHSHLKIWLIYPRWFLAVL